MREITSNQRSRDAMCNAFLTGCKIDEAFTKISQPMSIEDARSILSPEGYFFVFVSVEIFDMHKQEDFTLYLRKLTLVGEIIDFGYAPYSEYMFGGKYRGVEKELLFLVSGKVVPEVRVFLESSISEHDRCLSALRRAKARAAEELSRRNGNG